MDDLKRIRHRRQRLGPTRWFFRILAIALILGAMAAILAGVLQHIYGGPR